MPIPQLPGIINDPNANINDLVQGIRDYQIRLERELQFMMQSGLDSTNAFEFGGFRVKKDTFMHKTGLVGMSSAGTAPESIRFWSGHVDPLQGSFRVTQAGILTAVSALIMSALGYPRLELNSGSNLLAAYKTATDSLKINPNPTGSPSLIFDNGIISAIIGNTPTRFWIQGVTGIMRISSNNDIEISSGGKVKYDSWANILNTATNATLQQALDAITNSIPAGDYSVITIGAGGNVTSGRSLAVSDIPTLPQSKITNLTTDLASKAPSANPAFTGNIDASAATFTQSEFSAVQSTLQTIPATTFTKVLFQTESYDTLNEFATSTFTALKAGNYSYSACVAFSAPPANTRMILSIFVNGAEKYRLCDFTTGSTINDCCASGAGNVKLSATDAVEIRAFTTAGTTTNAGAALCYFTMKRQ